MISLLQLLLDGLLCLPFGILIVKLFLFEFILYESAIIRSNY